MNLKEEYGIFIKYFLQLSVNSYDQVFRSDWVIVIYKAAQESSMWGYSRRVIDWVSHLDLADGAGQYVDDRWDYIVTGHHHPVQQLWPTIVYTRKAKFSGVINPKYRYLHNFNWLDMFITNDLLVSIILIGCHCIMPYHISLTWRLRAIYKKYKKNLSSAMCSEQM